MKMPRQPSGRKPKLEPDIRDPSTPTPSGMKRKRGEDIDMVDASDSSSVVVVGESISMKPLDAQIDKEMAGLEQTHTSSSPVPEDGIQILGNRLRYLVEAINEFRQYGLDQVIDITELVLVGDQSAGKSSTMGALADIQLPKGSGTCTRCPARIMTTSGDAWSCKISLEQDYSYTPKRGHRITEKDVTLKNPFPPWAPQTRVVKHFATIYNKQELLETLKWAQIATLNPDSNHLDYVPGTTSFKNDESKKAEFSPNIVSVEIHGPDLPSLSFYDLPGVINAMGDENLRYLVQMIKNLVSEYLKRPKVLIICALAMNMDPNSSSTIELIQKHQVQKQCVGVLTKPDLLAEVGWAQWEDVLRGKTFKLKEGYFVTKHPAVNENTYCGDDFYSTARRDEIHFFETATPWKDEWSFAKDRCGIPQLQQFLSKCFADSFIEDLPGFYEKIDKRKAEIELELSELPELPSVDQLFSVTGKLRQFGNEVKMSLQKDREHHSFHSEWTKICEKFRDVVMGMRPGVNISVAANKVITNKIIINLDSDSECVDSPYRPFNGEGAMVRTPQKTKREETPLGVDFKTPNRGRLNGIARDSVTPRGAGPHADPYFYCSKSGKGRMSLISIQNDIKDNLPPGMFNVIEVAVYRQLCLKSLSCWHEPIAIFLGQTVQVFHDMVFKCFDKELYIWGQTPLYKNSVIILTDYIAFLKNEQKAINDALLDMELFRCHTIIEDVFERYCVEETSRIRNMRQEIRRRDKVRHDVTVQFNKTKAKHFSEEEKNEKLAALEEAITTAAKSVTDEALGVDPFSKELDVAGYVRGYYTYAAHRFIENVCQFTQGKFFRTAEEDIENLLMRGLKLSGPGISAQQASDTCNELMEEDDGIARQRRRLIEERSKLAESKAKLDKLSENLKTENWSGRNSAAPEEQGYAPPRCETIMDDGDCEM